MLVNNSLAKAIRFALIGGAATAAISTVPAFAEEAADGAKVERIAVTGSRIQRTDMETANPVIAFDAKDIQKTGVSSVAEFLRENAASGGFNESSTLSQAAGASSVGLKGFSSEYTLILLNGRRLPKNSAGGIFTDINQVPMAAVERIDILPDGASAIYGSDAVAGVINIITKKDFEGVHVSAKYGAAVQSSGLKTENIDGNETNVSIVAGASNEKTNILFSAEHLGRAPIEAIDREFGRTAFIEGHEGGEGRSTLGIPGYTVVSPTIDPTTGKPYVNGAAGQGSAAWSTCPADQVTSSGRCRYDFAPLYQLQPESDRQSIFTAINHEQTDDLSFDAQFRYTRAYTLTSNAPAPGQVDVSNSPFLADFLRNDRYKDDQAKAEEIIKLVEAGEASVAVGRRYLDFGNRMKDNTNETFEAVGGFMYHINDSWSLDFDIGHSKLTNRQIGAGGQLLSKEVSDAFNSPTSVLNPFVLNDCGSAALKPTCDALQVAIHRTGEYEVSFSSLVASGVTPWELPGGEIGVAAGVDFRTEKYQDRSDPATVAGLVIGGAGSNGGGTFNNAAAFAEFSLPIIEDMEVNLAVRNDAADWDIGDASQTTYSAKISYRPIDDLLLRASYGTGFKAPNLDDLFTAESAGVNNGIVDTRRCNEFGGSDCDKTEINSKSGGNPELKPETSVSYNIGAVYQITEEISASIDYWSLSIEDVVGSLSTQEILDEEAAGRLTHLVVRNSEGKLTDTNREGYVRSNLQNLTERSATGLIYNVQYNSEFSFGDISAKLKAEQFLSYETQNSATQPLCDSVADDAMQKFTLNGSVGYAKDDFDTALNMRFLPGYEDYDKRNTVGKTCELIGHYGAKVDKQGNVIDAGRSQHVASYFQLDWSAGYHLNDASRVSVGIRNLLDRDPSFSTPFDWPFYNQGVYSNVGRFFYAQYDLKF
ncbi:TonB-dependent receptor [Shewanella sp. JM162201]|uniref:TonB-dependent receptor n=1 Tax=Shewanella jiangmenensis TaxID=2837387 RepID=A0ABS5V5K8_9GAMM|nr:TonB-dependent receptor [Shewanella jiangmenensis]MBT1445747.1 TonB-dependent receptor [Shewanella jiangmenensis]